MDGGKASLERSSTHSKPKQHQEQWEATVQGPGTDKLFLSLLRVQPTSRAVTCAFINTERRSLLELRWRHVGEEAVDLNSCLSP
ncbi:unnamed protein product [Gadus morhua 'NCC']